MSPIPPPSSSHPSPPPAGQPAAPGGGNATSDAASGTGPGARNGTAPGAGAPSPSGGIVSDAAGWSLRMLTSLPGPLLVPGLLFGTIGAIIVVFGAVANIGLTLSASPQNGGLPLPSTATSGASAMLTAIVAGVWAASVLCVARAALRGTRVSIGSAFQPAMGAVAVAVVVELAITIGSSVFVVPGLAIAVVLMYAPVAAADGQGFVESLRTSLRLVAQDLGTTLLLFLIMVASVVVLGWTLLLLLAVVPFMHLLATAGYERLQGRSLPDPSRLQHG